jgi:acyl-CoA synthetase (AMP-forming)/AMP-acid ligase II
MVAAWKAGGVLVSVNPMNRERELGLLLADSRPSALICHDYLYRDVVLKLEGEARALVPEVVLTTCPLDLQTRNDPRLFRDIEPVACPGAEDLGAAIARHRGERPAARPIKPGDVAFLVYTSGTTGLPKCAVNKHRRLFMGGMFAGRALRELGPDDVIYCPLPMYHVTALMGGWCACLYTGATFAMARGFSASTFWDDIRKHNATGFNYVGEMARYLWNQPPSPQDRNHRVTNMMGAGLRHEIWGDFKKRFGIESVYEVYGGSESPGGFINLFNFDRTCGWSPRGWKVAAWDHGAEDLVRGADGRASRLGPGGRGVLLMAIDKHQKFDGYTDPEATQSKILRDVFASGDRWFNTGDLVLNQGHGHMQFIDRLGDTYRWRSENVATTQVEGALNGYRGVLESIVYGVEVPGMEGRTGMARLVLDDAARVDLAGLTRHLRASLPEYAVPRFLRLSRERSDVTGTFRYKKSDLKDEGYRGADANDAIWLIAPGCDPQPMSAALDAEIESGAIRL